MVTYEQANNGTDRRSKRASKHWRCAIGKAAVLASILILLHITAIFIVSLTLVVLFYPRNMMQRNVECLVDVLALIEESHELPEYIETHDMNELERDGLKKLGWLGDGGCRAMED